MPRYRCAYCHQDLGQELRSHCPHCGRVMLRPADATAKKVKRKRRQEPTLDGPIDLLPSFRPGKNPAILGAVILVFIVLGTLLTSQFQRPRTEVTIQADPIARVWREIDSLIIALQRFHNDTGRYPTETEGLVALVRDPEIPGWAGHYVNLIQPDPWKTPYRYTRTTAGPEVRSAGPDRTFNTKQDIYATVDTDENR